MNAQIRANRSAVSDRFFMLGFTIRTDEGRARAEVAVATHPSLFLPDMKAKRTPSNFYSSRASGQLALPRGEAVYLLPPEVLARFVGQERLYVGLAVAPERNGATPQVAVMPTEGSPYISLKGLTAQGLKRVRAFHRSSRGSNYGINEAAALEWAGDAAVPGMAKAPNGSPAAPAAPTAAPRGNGGSNGASSPAPIDYDDGFGPMKAPGTPGSPENPSPSPAAPAPVAQSYYSRAAPAPSRVQEIPPALRDPNKFIWPAGLPQPNKGLVTMFIEAYNARIDDGVRGEPAPEGPSQFRPIEDADYRARSATLKDYIPGIARELQTASGRREVSEAILLLTTAVSVDVFNLIKDRLPKSLFNLQLPGEPDLEPVSPEVAMPRALPYLSQRIGMFLAWVDLAIRRAKADTAERIGLQKEEWEMMKAGAGGVFSLLGFAPGPAGTVLSVLGIIVQGVLEAHGPKYDEEYSSFATAMQEVRQTYKALAGAILRGLIVQEFLRKTGGTISLDIPLHPDLEAYIGAHAAYALLGWEGELAFLGQPSAQAAALGRNPSRAPSYPHASARPFSGSAPAHASRAQGMFDLLPVDLKLRMFIPSPAILMEHPAISDRAFGGDGRGFQLDGGTSRAEITARFHFGNGDGRARLTDIRRTWGESTEYNVDDTEAVAGMPSWYRNKRPGATPIARDTLGVTDDNLSVQLGGSSTDGMISMAEGSVVVSFHVAGGMPLVSPAPDIDANLAVHVKVDGDRIKARVRGGHDEFPACEVCANGVLIYGYNPLDHDGTPFGLVGTGDFDVEPNTDYVDVGPATEYRVIGPVRIGGVGAQSLSRGRALGDESFTLNWDDLELVAQPTGVSCWSAAAAMMIGWRDRVSISPETIAEIAGRSLDQGMNREYANVQAFAGMMGLMWAEPQSYSVDSFRRLLEANGPLWVTKQVAADIPNLHAVIVTGLYSDGPNTFVRVTDPWDREIGVPGVPGAYLDTHATGSRYIMSWDQFMAEYEWLRYRDNQRPTGKQRDFLHILHAGGTGGRVPNYGPGIPPGYAQSLRSASTFGAQVRPLSEQSFTLNWDDVQPIPQPTDVSCWAAAAAMVVGWRELMSLGPETIAQITSRTTATGLDPAQVEQFAREIGIVFKYPQSYTVDGFRNLLEANGPLWVGAAVPGLHAIVVTGMYHDGTNTFIRITDPWDRQVGTPGASGPYLQTHSTGSRYIMRWEDFVREYETAATDNSRVNLQILHAVGTGGRTPNYGPPAGYAQALRAARTPDRRVAMERYATAHSNHAASGGTSPTMTVGRHRETGSRNGTVWELDQLDGFKRPAGQNGDATIGTDAERRVNLDDWPYVPSGDGETRLPLTVSWNYGNGTVGNIRINAGEPRSVSGWTHRVTADIADGPETAKIAAVRVVVCHKFGSSGRPDVVAVTELTLFGDGTYQRQDRWEQTQAAAA